MSKYITKGTIAGLLTLAGAVSIALHKPVLAAFLNDPTTAAQLTAVLIGASGLAAGFLKGVEGK